MVAAGGRIYVFTLFHDGPDAAALKCGRQRYRQVNYCRPSPPSISTSRAVPKRRRPHNRLGPWKPAGDSTSAFLVPLLT